MSLSDKYHTVAFIEEKDCVGCTKCLDVCPVDAIVGASQQMHTVIINECIGCELCIPPCPVDCIIMKPIEREKTLDAHHIKKRLAAHRDRKKKRQSLQTTIYQTEAQHDDTRKNYLARLLKNRKTT